MEANAGKIAANSAKRTPKVGCEGMQVVKDGRPRIKSLPYVCVPNQQESFALRPGCHPRKRKVVRQSTPAIFPETYEPK